MKPFEKLLQRPILSVMLQRHIRCEPVSVLSCPNCSEFAKEHSIALASELAGIDLKEITSDGVVSSWLCESAKAQQNYDIAVRREKREKETQLVMQEIRLSVISEALKEF